MFRDSTLHHEPSTTPNAQHNTHDIHLCDQHMQNLRDSGFGQRLRLSTEKLRACNDIIQP